MKKMRKLLPAFAMLLVSAIMLSTASFAWFSTNTRATAGGMKVQATTSGGLAIAFAIPDASSNPIAPSNDNYKSSVTLADTDWTNDGYKLNPTSVKVDGSAWYTASADKTDVYSGAKGTWSQVTTNQNQYYFKSALYVRSLNEETTGDALFVDKINVTTGTGSGSQLEKALRVAIHTGSTWLFFAPNYTEGSVDVTTFKYVSGITGDGENTEGTTSNYTATQLYLGQNALTGAQLLAAGTNGVKYDNPTQVEVYVYFEGEDTNCTSALAYDLRDLIVEVTFTTTD